MCNSCSGTCVDSLSTGINAGGKPASCSRLVALNQCTNPALGARIRASCPKSCNSCPGTCEDALSTGIKAGGKPVSCSKLGAMGACAHQTLGAKIRLFCPKTCGICPGAFCKDHATSGLNVKGKRASCSQVAELSFCGHSTYGAIIQARCPKSCGACRTQAPTTFSPTAAPTRFPTFAPTTVDDYSSLTPTVSPSVSWLTKRGVKGDCWDTRRHEAQNWEECKAAYKRASGSEYHGTQKSIESSGTRDDGEPSR